MIRNVKSIKKQTYHDGGFNLAIFPGVVSSSSQKPQLALFRNKPAGQFGVPVSNQIKKRKSETVMINYEYCHLVLE